MENISLFLIMITTYDNILDLEFPTLIGNYTTKQQGIMPL